MKTNFFPLIVFSLPALAAVTVYPPSVDLPGRNASQLVAVSSGDRDITADCAFQLSNTAIASISKTGLITATADGRSTLTVSCKGERATVPVAVASAHAEPKLSFVKDVVPIFTM